ncbi:hypothetical protein A2W24_01380 [Microgenomates group bacterium RBG_16_45_19]|nr:MAG: hypothetical protein A2W24_01380 [Microgenomates group bacterium RBG_16_45_19]
MNYGDVIHPDDIVRMAKEVSDYVQQGVVEFIQIYRVFTRSGDVRWLEDHSLMRRNPQGELDLNWRWVKIRKQHNCWRSSSHSSRVSSNLRMPRIKLSSKELHWNDVYYQLRKNI